MSYLTPATAGETAIERLEAMRCFTVDRAAEEGDEVERGRFVDDDRPRDLAETRELREERLEKREAREEWLESRGLRGPRHERCEWREEMREERAEGASLLSDRFEDARERSSPRLPL